MAELLTSSISVDTQDSLIEETELVSVSLLQVYQRGEKDINFFASICMPTVCSFSLPPFYVAIFTLLTLRKEVDIGKLMRFALGLPRGHAKTTFIKILICWLIVYDKASFILIICSNQDLAENLLADIHDILSSPNLTQVYGNWSESLAIDSADTKKAAFHRRSVSLVARGWAAGVRGINLQNERPDVIFCDDCQTRKNDESLTERLTLLKELVGTVFKAIAPKGNRLIIYVGNMYSEDCLLNKFRKSASWISMVTGAILSDGKPLWPELFSLEELMESYYHDADLGLADIWFAEVMNDPRSSSLSIFPNALPASPYEVEELIENNDGGFITIDPAGFRVLSDDNVITINLKRGNEAYTVHTNKELKKPDEIVQETISLALRYNCSLIGVEAVAYQQTLAFWLSYFLRAKNITHITVVELHPHGRTKESRIRQYISELYALNFFIASHETRRDYTWQASLYKVGKKDNRDDLLDAVAYVQDIRNDYWHLIVPLTHSFTIQGECSVLDNFNNIF